MPTPTSFIGFGILFALLGIIGAVLNIATFASGRYRFGATAVIHLLCGLLYVGGGLSLLAGLVMFFIQYAKHA